MLNGLGYALNNLLANDIYVKSVGTYEDILGKGCSIFTRDLDNLYKGKKIKEIAFLNCLKKIIFIF